jgi:hypothetical protein
MVNPQIAAAVIGAMLFAGLSQGGLYPAMAAPIAASSEENAPPPVATQPVIAPHGRVYLFRGALGPFFSRGMDRLTDRLEKAGVTANVYEFTICRLIAEKAIREYRQDPAHATDDVPLNVERFINIFLSKSVLGGGDVKAVKGYQGHYASFDLSEHDEVSHINIEKMDTVHQQVLAKVLQLATTPAKLDSESVPLRYVVPPDAGIELWDSGMPVFARPGDTLQTIAAAHHVPLWSLTQMNKGPDGAPLVPGERIIVPRHLVPLTEVSGQSPSRR